VRQEFKGVITRDLLAARELEWTVHGAQRSFRFWSAEERVGYVRFAASLAADLQELTPKACLGFGAALGSSETAA
jgi:hypothetical protein